MLDVQKQNKLGLLSMMEIILSIYVLVAIVVDTVMVLPYEVSHLIHLIDNLICIFFLFEFSVRFYLAENKLKFMKWGWIDLVSSIPYFTELRAGRTLRLIRLLRILRVFRSIRVLVNHVYNNRAQGAFNTVSVIAVLMVLFGSIAILQVEGTANGNIHTAEDALWWALVTITTVGYGDKVPVTTEGRIIAGFLMTAGVALVGTFTGFAASWFFEKEEEKRLKAGGALGMAGRIYHQVLIKADKHTVYDAVTLQTGLSKWWIAQCIAMPEVGFVNEFRLGEYVNNRMKITDLVEDERVEWECIKGDEEWVGTHIIFNIAHHGDYTKLDFRHTGWSGQSEFFATCNYHWARHLQMLVDYCETGKNQLDTEEEIDEAKRVKEE